MSIRYDISAAEIIRLFGYDRKVDQSLWDKFMPGNVPLPKGYREFMEIAIHCPMLGTSDIWVGRIGEGDLHPYFLYEEIEEAIEDQKEDWEEDLEFRAESSYYPFSQLPKERWPELVCDYLEIGSDYGAGVVNFGIRKEDLEKDDPPVWMNHEADPITEWKKLYESVSDYLMEMLLNVLAGVEYELPEKELEENGWEYVECEEYEMPCQSKEELLSAEQWMRQELLQDGIDMEQMHCYNSVTNDGKLYYCYEEEKQHFYLGRIEKSEVALFCIQPETENED